MTENFNLDYLLLKLALYEPITISEDNGKIFEEQLINSLHAESQFDCYCIECKKESTFKLERRLNIRSFSINTYPKSVLDRLNVYQTPFTLEYKCQRNDKHKYSFFFRISDNKLIKVGQYPSVASIEMDHYKKYRGILKEDYNAFSKAIGLYSHGIGAGSFVYLRRIFENLIEETRNEAANEQNWDNIKYQHAKMDEKIKLLKDKLPEFLVENRRLYGILSKGIHELSEKECLEIFEPVKIAIELILDEKLEKRNKQKKISSISKFISSFK